MAQLQKVIQCYTTINRISMYYSGQAIQAIQHMFVTTQLAGSADLAPDFVIDHFLCFDVAEPRGTVHWMLS